jgi:DNA modification methylase
MTVELYLGDCLEYMRGMEARSVDAVVTDPPYGIGFNSGWTGSCISGDNDLTLRDEVLKFYSSVPCLVFGSPLMPIPKGTKSILIWHRPGSGMGDLSFPWKPDYEFIYVIGKGFSYPKRTSSVMSIAWDTFRGDALHPHQKPISLVKMLLDRLPKNCTIFDPFMGSGTTGIACMQTGRNFIGCEIDPGYFEIAKRRIEQAQMQPLLELTYG